MAITMINNRHGESGNIPFRSGRFYNVDSEWYYCSRENSDIGPFHNRQDADEALNVFLQDVANLAQITAAS